MCACLSPQRKRQKCTTNHLQLSSAGRTRHPHPEISGVAMSDMGHNGGPAIDDRPKSIRRKWATCLFARPNKPVGAVAMAFVLYFEMNGAGEGAAISDQEFASACGVSDRAVRTFKKWLIDEGFVAVEMRGARGRGTTFRATIPDEIPERAAGISVQLAEAGAVIEHEIPAPIAGSSQEYRHPLPEVRREIPARASASSEIAERASGISGLPEAGAGNRESSSRAYIESPSGILIPKKLSEESSPSPSQPKTNVQPVESWGTAFAAPDHEDVVLQNGRIVLLNGARSFWVGQFDGHEGDLNLALIEAAGSIQPNSKQPVKLQVERILARKCSDRREKDRRYARAVKDRESKAAEPAKRRGGRTVTDICMEGIRDERRDEAPNRASALISIDYREV